MKNRSNELKLVRNFHWDELFVLCCLWNIKSAMRLFLSPDLGLVFNINYEVKNVLNAIERLTKDHLLEITHENGDRVDEWMLLIKNSHSRDKENRLVIGLTPASGFLWEKYFDVSWDSYVSFLEPDECGGWLVRVFDFYVLQDVLLWAENHGVANDFFLSVKQVNQLIYWKNAICYEIKIVSKAPIFAEEELDGRLNIFYAMCDFYSKKFDAKIDEKLRSVYGTKIKKLPQ